MWIVLSCTMLHPLEPFSFFYNRCILEPFQSLGCPPTSVSCHNGYVFETYICVKQGPFDYGNVTHLAVCWILASSPQSHYRSRGEHIPKWNRQNQSARSIARLTRQVPNEATSQTLEAEQKVRESWICLACYWPFFLNQASTKHGPHGKIAQLGPVVFAKILGLRTPTNETPAGNY